MLRLMIAASCVALAASAAAQAPAAQPLVVVDPGHGGTNAGAPGAVPGVYEKHVTLALSRCLRGELERRGFQVVLTRERDRYLSLRQRARRANELGADLFVSVHANATEGHDQRGYETYILTPEAVDVDGRALRTDDGVPRPGLDVDTARLLDDVERGLALTPSASLALAMQNRLREVRGPEHDRGVKQASMHVLLGLTMPAVLVEVGFVDHPVEGKELVDPAVQRAICEALADAVDASR